MDTEKYAGLILNHISEPEEKCPGLRLLDDDSGAFIVKGKLTFSAQYDCVSIEDEYEVKILIPIHYRLYVS